LVYDQYSLIPVIVPPAVRQKVVVAAARAMVEGSVRCNPTPVSPVTPLSVRACVLPVGGTMVHAVGVVPPVGTVMVFAPDARVLISTDPALAAFVAAVITSVPVTSPEKVIVVDRVADTLMPRSLLPKYLVFHP
jgi:hypothetical protein